MWINRGGGKVENTERIIEMQGNHFLKTISLGIIVGNEYCNESIQHKV